MSEGRFNYRVGAIILDAGQILMVRNSGSPFYYTVGGRVKFGESAREAVLREVCEETQMRLVIDRLAYIHENFFAPEGENAFYHEVCLFFSYEAQFPAARDRSRLFQGGIRGSDTPLASHWRT